MMQDKIQNRLVLLQIWSRRFGITGRFIRVLVIIWVLLWALSILGIASSHSVSPLKELPQNDVNCIYTDEKGFVWIGTLDGLHRYDGYNYKTYRIGSDENSISSNMVITVDEDSKGNIWIGTYGKGICRLDPETEHFVRYTTTADTVYTLPSDDVTCMLVDSRDVIWVGNWYGAYRIYLDDENKRIKQVVTLPLETAAGDNALYEIKTIHEDQNRVLWIGTNLNLVQVLNPYRPAQEIRYTIHPYNTEVISDYPGGILIGGQQVVALKIDTLSYEYRYRVEELAEIPSNALLYATDSVIWIGNRSGVGYLQHETEGWVLKEQYQKNESNGSLSSNIITTITSDRAGKLWIGTRGGGINTIALHPSTIEHYQHSSEEASLADNLVRCIYEDGNKNLWIGTEEGGVSLLHHSKALNYSQGFQHLTISDNINGNRVYAIDEMQTPKSALHKSLLWMGTSYPTHLVAVDPVSLRVKNQPEWIEQIGFVFAIEVQNDSTLWVGTYGEGLWRFRVDQEGAIEGYSHFSPDAELGYSISSSIIRSLLLDSQGCLWIGTDKGLNRIHEQELNKEKPKIQQYQKGEGFQYLSFDYVLQVYEAKNKKIWIGTMGGGLIGFNEDRSSESWTFTSLTTEDGLPNNSVKSILEDDTGNLWLSSNNGLSRYNPNTGGIVNYDMQDGLQDNEFSEISACKRSNGQMVFGGINGFNVFYPEEIERDTVKPKLFFTDFYLLNKLVNPGDVINDRVVLEQAMEYTQSIELNHNENSFSLGFVALQLKAPQKNKYKYILEGFDEQWYSASSNHRLAKYTNIPSGNYVFKVLGSNSDDVWVEEPIELSINIAPPPYRSALALILYTLLAILIAVLLYRWYRYNSARKQELLISQIEKENIEEVSLMKLQFFTNISHEFRTPLTLIDAPLERLIRRNKTLSQVERMEHYGLIRQNVNVMLRLVNQIMDFRRLERNKMKLNARKRELNSFVKTIYNSFAPWAKQKEIEFEYIPNFSSLKMWFDPDKIEKVLYNLLSNAFKFTPKQGKVELLITRDDTHNMAIISVKDTGVGIAKEEQQRIFERYYQPSKKYKQSFGGTGIGLALSKGLIEIHQGTIQFSSVKGEGSTFTIALPLGETHLKPEERIEDESKAQEGFMVPVIQDDQVITEADAYLESASQRFSILITEDNYDLRNFLAGYFEKQFQVHTAENGAQGLEVCKDIVPDIIISDIMMPEMDGIEFCEKIREDENLSHIPIILLTAKNTDASQIEGFETGADAYLAKPFSAEVLKARVVSLIKNRLQLRMKYEKEVHLNPDTAGNSPADAKFLESIIEIAEDNLSDSGFNVERLADKYGVSRIYINRKVKALTGETSNQFLRNIRLRKAAELLKQNQHTVSEITWQVGYNDLRTFRSRFKEKFGMSPSEYAREQEQKRDKKAE